MRLHLFVLLCTACMVAQESPQSSPSPSQCNESGVKHNFIGDTDVCYTVGLPKEFRALSAEKQAEYMEGKEAVLRELNAFAESRKDATRAGRGEIDAKKTAQTINKKLAEACEASKSFPCKKESLGKCLSADRHRGNFFTIAFLLQKILQQIRTVSPGILALKIKSELREICEVQ